MLYLGRVGAFRYDGIWGALAERPQFLAPLSKQSQEILPGCQQPSTGLNLCYRFVLVSQLQSNLALHRRLPGKGLVLLLLQQPSKVLLCSV